MHLYGIDAPETQQPFGWQAKAALSRLALEQKVTVYLQTTNFYGDCYGWAFRGKRNLNAELIQLGLAWQRDPFATLHPDATTRLARL